MEDSTTPREKMLKQVRKALIQPSPNEMKDVDKETDLYVNSEGALELQFAQNFSDVDGKFVFCESENEFVENLKYVIKENNWDNIYCVEPLLMEFLKYGEIPFSNNEDAFLKTNIGITFCECLIARTGSIVISSKQASGRRLPIFPNIHVVAGYSSQLVPDIKDGLGFILNKYNKQLPSMITTISGPSRTADIEKTLVKGAHGPKELYVFLIDDITSEE